jgi:hypothetical protein
VVAILNVGAATAIAVAALLLFVHHGAPARSAAPDHRARIPRLQRAVVTSESHDFHVLTEPISPNATIPLNLARDLTDASGPNVLYVRLARRARVPAGRAWVVPGDGVICVLAQATSGAQLVDDACGSVASSAALGDVWSLGGSHLVPGKVFLAGLVPNQVDQVLVRLANGHTTTVAVRDNVYVAMLNRWPVMLRFVSPRGVEQVAL